MNYMVINASPKRPKNSITMITTNKFIEGIREEDPSADIEIVNLASCHIEPCRSCYFCWSHLAEGECFITKKKQDDMHKLMEIYLNADKIIISTPMHFFSISSYAQKFLERTFPLIKPVYLDEEQDLSNTDVFRDMSMKDMAVIVTCKVIFEGVWNSIDEQMKLLSRNKYQGIFSTQPTTAKPKDKVYVDSFLEVVFKAGQEFARTGKFANETREELDLQIQRMSENVDTLRIGR